MMQNLKLSKEIYDYKKLLLVIDAYKEISNISLRSDDDYFYLNFSKCTYDVEETIKEFENYLIDISNKE